MTYLIDTCVMSEFVKKAPNPQVSHLIAYSLV